MSFFANARKSLMHPKSKMQIPLIILVLILQSHILPFSHCKSIVKNLPSFSGDLPFTLETGYVGVGKHEEAQLFYYFVESQRNPQKDPLFLYLTGGPGTSGIIPFLFQIVLRVKVVIQNDKNEFLDYSMTIIPKNGKIGRTNIFDKLFALGPLKFVYTNATRTDVKLELNPYSWTKTANVIFIDLPVDTGFSYVKANESLKNSDSLAVTHACDFIRKWLMDHPKFLNNPLYITGISYMGLFIPRVISYIYDGNDRGILPQLNIKGFLIVSPLTDKFIDFNSRTVFAYRAALIEDELYKPAKENCRGKYINVDPNNTLCLNSLKPINEDSIYEFSNTWANKKSVRQALHIRKGTVENFQFSNSSISDLPGDSHSIYYTHDIYSSLAYHRQLLTKECQALIINGDHDMTFPYVGTQKWIKSLKLRVETPWKPWFVHNQVAGYEKTYSKAKYSMKYATIKGAGHSVALYKPEEAMVILETWLASHTNSTK
ncbi:peptidase S10, serine carboxypeptidase, Alpha/Beta hydrolase fold protein [Artemisia annua]|uniref:Peptidase S10, serine carboxypeptidase, Alpha/Beta hydrolase fold protein n=1 Tax=Artemisia annua TaxID=35608 RepID=A0A2U1M627_ARTAN|nr:peptidase S10, serine carboxypeptidase, Alpha/Beta hydrolase fold protein [Artemisia annua]